MLHSIKVRLVSGHPKNHVFASSKKSLFWIKASRNTNHWLMIHEMNQKRWCALDFGLRSSLHQRSWRHRHHRSTCVQQLHTSPCRPSSWPWPLAVLARQQRLRRSWARPQPPASCTPGLRERAPFERAAWSCRTLAALVRTTAPVRYTSYITPEIIYFHYLKSIFSESKYPKMH